MMLIKINTDGGARGNPGPGASSVIVKNESGKILHKEAAYLGVTTNNIAEYNGALLAFKWLKGQTFNKGDKITLSMDSLLVVKQLKREYKIKSPPLLEFAKQIWDIQRKLGIEVHCVYVPRIKNQEADQLVNETLDEFAT